MIFFEKNKRMNTLPKEILRYEILGFMQSWELYSLRFVSKNFRDMIQGMIPKKRFLGDDSRLRGEYVHRAEDNGMDYIEDFYGVECFDNNNQRFYIILDDIYNQYGECVFRGVRTVALKVDEPENTDEEWSIDVISWDNVKEVENIGGCLRINTGDVIKKNL